MIKLLKALSDDDDPKTRAYPANLTILEALYKCLDVNDARWGSFNAHTIDLAIIAFFWLLRPSEYLEGTGETRTEAFEFRDVEVYINGKYYLAPAAPLNDERTLDRMRYSQLIFSDQKNAVRSECVGHTANDDPRLCPVKALGRVV